MKNIEPTREIIEKLDDFTQVSKAIAFLSNQEGAVSTLDQVAEHVGLSPFHFHRMFTQWAGVSPKEFQQAMTLLRAKPMLKSQSSLLKTSLEVGLSGTSRLHDLFLSIEKMTPGEYKTGGRDLTLHWSFFETPLGEALFVVAPKGLCHFGFVSAPGGREEALQNARAEWPSSTWVESASEIEPLALEVVRRLSGLKPQSRLGLLLKGTDLRVKVWMALLEISAGRVSTYSEVAAAVGVPKAVRAVATCIAQNPIAVLIPCHRVIRASGALNEYRWGIARKAVLVAEELRRGDPYRG
jgi:AraC family transcriptional regulator of adaptative response/methylated-DNA-[protein]-cysteine methyltransferase